MKVLEKKTQLWTYSLISLNTIKTNRLNHNYFFADFLAKEILKKSFRIENALKS